MLPTTPWARRWRALCALLVGSGLLLSACKKPTRVASPTLREAEDPFNRIYQARLDSGRVAEFSTTDLPKEAFTREPFERGKPEKPVERQKLGKLHPLLQRWLVERPSTDTELIVVNFQDSLKIPRFPEPAVGEQRDSPLNRKAIARSQELIEGVVARRAATYRRLAGELRADYHAEVLETFWLVSAASLRLPLDAVRRLTERKDVLYLEPERTGDIPPQNTNAGDDVDDGRSRIVSDPYFNLGQTGGWIGLLDTGMRFTHAQFTSPSHVDFRRDCVSGGNDCNTGSSLNPNDDCWNHGTSTGAIVTANGRQGDAFRGITAITLDSWKVYPTSFNSSGGCAGGLSTTAAVRGFQAAVAALDRVIVAEMQGSGNYLSTIPTAADNAFDAGAVVVAANGNNGPSTSTVNAPASAHRVIGVGNFDVQSLGQITSQSRGPTPDGRFKPDVQAPTNTETASNASDVAFRVFSGTSGATPYGAGVAALLRNWLRGTSFSIDPGQVYAQVILSGQQPYPFNNTSGAGPLRLPTDGWAWWGKVSVGDGETIDIPLSIGGGTLLDGALWWPETAYTILGLTIEPHSDVDLHLISPSGGVAASSVSIPSVFERARVSGSVASGTWRLRIRGYSVPFGRQTVYWAAHVRVR